MFESKDGMFDIRDSRSLTLKNPAVVIAIARRVNGSNFARSFDRSSLTYAVARTDATTAAEISRTVFISSPFARIRIRIERIVNQKKVRTGSRIIYSTMKKRTAKNLTAAGFEYWLYWFRLSSMMFFLARNL